MPPSTSACRSPPPIRSTITVVLPTAGRRLRRSEWPPAYRARDSLQKPSQAMFPEDAAVAIRYYVDEWAIRGVVSTKRSKPSCESCRGAGSSIPSPGRDTRAALSRPFRAAAARTMAEAGASRPARHRRKTACGSGSGWPRGDRPAAPCARPPSQHPCFDSRAARNPAPPRTRRRMRGSSAALQAARAAFSSARTRRCSRSMFCTRIGQCTPAGCTTRRRARA